MALASDMAWDGLSTRGAASPSIGTRQALFWSVAAGALLVLGALAAPALLSRVQGSFPAHPTIAAPARHAPPSNPRAASHLSFERDAESFLRDSLALEAGCDAGCGRLAAVVADAAKFVHLGIGQPASALTLGRSFGLPAGKPAVSPAAPATPAPPPAAPVRLVVTPSVVVPLAPPAAAEPIPVPVPVPAPRLDRPATTPSPRPVEQQASLPPAVAAPISVPAAPAVGRNDGVAVYDISAALVYMPDGTRLEAHSGLGSMVDDPRYVDRRDVGPTPPNTYNLVMRKGRFHGVDAVRLIPVNGDNKYGRIGLLAHPYMLRGRPGESNGCVVFRDYNRFLDAFMRGKVKRMVVVASLKGSPLRVAAAT